MKIRVFIPGQKVKDSSFVSAAPVSSHAFVVPMILGGGNRRGGTLRLRFTGTRWGVISQTPSCSAAPSARSFKSPAVLWEGG